MNNVAFRSQSDIAADNQRRRAEVLAQLERPDTSIPVKVKRLHPDAVTPRYATAGSAGFDLAACEDVIIAPGETKLVRTGLAFEIPDGYEIQLRPRSGISLRTKLRISNAPATIDRDFRGEVAVIVDNIYGRDHDEPCPDALVFYVDGSARLADSYEENCSYIIRAGDRIAQGVIAPVYRAEFTEVDGELTETGRGNGGFGSTGVSG